jgi:hypothetical protein
MMAGLGINPAFNWQRFGGNALQDIGVGLTQAPNVWGGIGRGAQINQAQQPYRDQMATLEEERKREALEKNQTSEWIKANFPQYSNLPPAQAWQAAMGDLQAKRTAASGDNLTTDQRNWMMAQKDPEFAAFLNENGGGVEYGLTPIWGQLPDGSFAYGVQGKDGTFKAVDTGDINPLDPRSLNEQRAYGAKVGGITGEATASAPGDIATGRVALDLVNQIKTSPELGWATGTSAGLGGNMVPGTGRFGFQNLVDQAKSGAFLTAIQEMRGLGALSNAEGQAATQAITRMNTALSTQDFLKAVDDYERIVKTGMERAQARLNADGPVINPGAQPAQTSTGVQWSYEP